MRLARLALLTSLAGCNRIVADTDFERMIEQDKCEAYDVCPWLPHDRTMQHPPDGTVPRGRILGQPALTEGMVGGSYVTSIPVAIDEELMHRGRDRFEIFCAACHGVIGDSETEVAENMRLRKPPSLHEPGIRAYPPGRVYQAIAKGYGLMPSYASQLPVRERWAVVAYVQALQLSQNLVLADYPKDVRRTVLEELP